MKIQDIKRHGYYFCIYVITAAVLALPARTAAALVVAERDGILYLQGNTARVQYDLETGYFDLMRPGGEIVIRNGMAEALVTGASGTTFISLPGARKLGWFYTPVEDRFGKGIEATVVRHGEGNIPDISHTIRLYEGEPFVFFSAAVENFTGSTVDVQRISPLVISTGAGGGLFLGLSPGSVRIAGCEEVIDENIPPSELIVKYENNPPQPGRIYAALFDPRSQRGLAAGFLAAKTAEPHFAISKTGPNPVEDSDTGRTGIPVFTTSSDFFPYKEVRPNNILTSETLFFEVAWQEPYEAMDRYVRTVMLENNPGEHNPAAIASWTSGGVETGGPVSSPGGIMKNIAVAADMLAPFGLDAAGIGPGWQDNYGDWAPAPQFDGEMEALAAQAGRHGLIPSIWLSPFLVDEDSELFAKHPEWIIDNPLLWAKSMMPYGKHALDISRPDVLEYLSGVVRRITGQWGFRALRLEAHPCALGAAEYAGGGSTRVEILRAALEALKEAAGDGVRLTVDGVPPEFSFGIAHSAGPFCDTCAETAHMTQPDDYLERILFMADRYSFFNGRVFLFSQAAVPGPLPDTGIEIEDRGDAYMKKIVPILDAAAVTGGDINIEASLVDMDAPLAELIRRALPASAGYAAPADIFSKSVPEVFGMKGDGASGDYAAASVFNRQSSPAEAENAPKERKIHFYYSSLGFEPNSECLLYDFWNDAYLDKHKFGYSSTLAAGESKMLFITKATDIPSLLSTGRNLADPSAGIDSLEWDDRLLAMNVKMNAVRGFDYRLTFHVPAGLTVLKASLNSFKAGYVFDKQTGILRLRFRPSETGAAEWQIDFEKE